MIICHLFLQAEESARTSGSGRFSGMHLKVDIHDTHISEHLMIFNINAMDLHKPGAFDRLLFMFYMTPFPDICKGLDSNK